MKNIGDVKVKHMTLFIAIASSIVMFLILIPYFIIESTDERNSYLTDIGETTAEYIALAIEYPLASRNIEYTQNILDKALSNVHISQVTILDAMGNVFVEKNEGVSNIVIEKSIFVNYLPSEIFSVTGKVEVIDETINKTSIGKVILGINTDKSSQTNYEVILEVIFLGAIAILISIIAGTIVGKRLTEPLLKLAFSVKKLREGNYNISLLSTNKNEIGEISNNINSLAIELHTLELENEKHVKELIDATKSSEKLVKQRTQELLISRDKAISANEKKNKFLAHISHEFRTPLQAIVSYLSLIKSNTNVQNDSVILSDLDSVNYSCHILLERVNEILEYKVIDQGLTLDVQEDINIVTLVNRVSNSLNSLAQNNNNKIYVEENREEIRILSDGYKVQKILINIISNACKYTHNGNINIAVTTLSLNDLGHVCICVKDDGIGIPENELVTIFEPFVRSSKNIENIKGTGLGLAICKDLVKSINGTITLSSSDKGTNVEIRLPYIVSNIEPKQILVNEKIDRSGVKILLADDDEIIRSVLVRILKSNNHQVTAVSDGEEALEYISNQNFELLILDLNMPKKTGLDVIEYLNRSNTKLLPPIIVLTADTTEDTKEKIVRQGVKILEKPIDSEKLLEEIGRITTLHEKNKILHYKALDLKKIEILEKLEVPKEAIIRDMEAYIIKLKNLAEQLIKVEKKSIVRTIHQLRGISETLGAERIDHLMKRISQSEKYDSEAVIEIYRELNSYKNETNNYKKRAI